MVTKTDLLNTLTDLYTEHTGACPDWPAAVRWARQTGLITAGERTALLTGTPLP